MSFEQPLLLFLALMGLYSPLAALPSYFPIVGRLDNSEQLRLALALFVNVAAFSMVALWVGEPLLHVLGLSTAALTATGGIALLYEGVALMRGTAHPPTADDGVTALHGAAASGDHPETHRAERGARQAVAVEPAVTSEAAESWRKVVFVPVTFPLTVGGTTFAFFVAFRAEAPHTGDVLLLSTAGLAYAAVTGLTLYAAGHVHRRSSAATAALLDRLAGILLTAIAVTILVSGVTRLVAEFWPGT